MDGAPVTANIWRKPLSENRDLYQTTVQRWFADPILSPDGQGGPLRDRTLRTVFSHDHFGASSLQQHGFYSALVIEPEATFDEETGEPRHGLLGVCREDGEGCYAPPAIADQLTSVAWGDETMTGARKIVLTQDGNDPSKTAHPDFREFALAVADFALLYDPRDRRSEDDFLREVGVRSSSGGAGGSQGMAQLYCEALWRRSPALLNAFCGAEMERDGGGSWFAGGDVPPAWIAGGVNRDDRHRQKWHGDLFVEGGSLAASEIADLRRYLVGYRQKAAGMLGAPASQASLARPVAPPARPEAISVDHHDPYLLNYRGAPIPLRIGDSGRSPESAQEVAGKVRHSDGCAPLGIARQGEDAGGGESDVVRALETGSFGTCSVSHQLEGERGGDMATALSSFVHGDPATPVLEAYQGERMMVRLIQGAQEVQHTFRVLGKPIRRNADQLFPRGMMPPGESAAYRDGPTLHRQCAEKLAHGRPLQYRTWLEEGPESGDFSAGDQAYWREYERLLAICDNGEGFTFAQELGISEHFELQGSLRADVDSGFEFRLLTDDRSPRLDTRAPDESAVRMVPEGVSDNLYDLGSLDSIWNGAWGLLRTFRDPGTAIPGTGGEIGSRLATIASAREAAALESGQSVSDGVLPSPVGALSCPLNSEFYASGGNFSSEAVIVAVKTADIWGERVGTDYRGPRHDPDGLMLALLPPESLVAQGLYHEAGSPDDDPWQRLTRADVIAQIRTAYADGPEPMVMRVNAGDCVSLRLVNLLTEEPGGGLRDLLGDALAPKITPLNLDPASGPGATDAAGRVREYRMDRPVDSSSPGGVRPSAWLALRVGLPGMELSRDIPLGYGYTRPAIEPASADGGTVPVSAPMMFFAGRYWLNLKDAEDEQVLLEAVVSQLVEETEQGELRLRPVPPRDGQEPYPETFEFALRSGDAPLQLVEARDGPGLIELLGKRYDLRMIFPRDVYSVNSLEITAGGASGIDVRDLVCADAADQDCVLAAGSFVDDLAFEVTRLARLAVDERTHWIPYAFGAVPVTSTSDVISHNAHGLFGVIDVVPRDWDIEAASHRLIDTGVGAIRRRSVGHVPAGDGLPATYAVTRPAGPGNAGEDANAQPPAPQETRVREFVLFYQDGLNLWDRDSTTNWVWADSTSNRRRPVSDGLGGGNLRAVADCHACDDSYDFGDFAVNYVSVSYNQMLRDQSGHDAEAHDDLNEREFPAEFLKNAPEALRLQACEGEQVLIRVVHPGGRARQRAFVTNGYGYDELFPGFGFPNAALLAPGKTVSAWLTPSMRPGKAVWHDGPLHIRAGGAWGLIDVSASGERLGDGAETCPGL